jgi:hypothetical protein
VASGSTAASRRVSSVTSPPRPASTACAISRVEL